VLEAFVFGLLTFVWRIAPVADGLVRHPWLVGIEALSLLVAGVALFSDLVESPPLRPRAPRPVRIGIAAVEMWAVWIVAYVYGMSHSSWYVAFHYVAGRGLSQTADQQLSSAVIWLTSAAVFLSVAFWNLAQWLRNEEDLGDELDQLVREERSRGFFGSRDF
jgi:cytochrome c oxidase assembly factor CtaG